MFVEGGAAAAMLQLLRESDMSVFFKFSGAAALAAAGSLGQVKVKGREQPIELFRLA